MLKKLKKINKLIKTKQKIHLLSGFEASLKSFGMKYKSYELFSKLVFTRFVNKTAFSAHNIIITIIWIITHGIIWILIIT